MEFKLLSQANINAAAKMFNEGFKSNSPIVAYWTDTLERALKKDLEASNFSDDDLNVAKSNLQYQFFCTVIESLNANKNIDFFKYLLKVETNVQHGNITSILIGNYYNIFLEDSSNVSVIKGDTEIIKFLLDLPEFIEDDEEYEKYFKFFIENKDLLTEEVLEDSKLVEEVFDFYDTEDELKLSSMKIKGVANMYDGVVGDIDKKIFTAIFRQAFILFAFNGDDSIISQFKQDIPTIKRLIPSTMKMNGERFSKWQEKLIEEFSSAASEKYDLPSEIVQAAMVKLNETITH